MVYVKPFFILFLCLLAFVLGHEATGSHRHHHSHDQDNDEPHHTSLTESYIELTPGSIDNYLQDSIPVLIAFTAPWCGVCQKFKPEYLQIAKAFHKEKVIIANADVEKFPLLGQRFTISSFPTIKYFSGTFTSDLDGENYESGRSSYELAKFLNSKLHTSVEILEPPSYSLILDSYSYNQFIASKLADNVSVLVLYYANWCSQSMQFLPIWENIGKMYNGENSLVLAKVNGEHFHEIIVDEGIELYPTLLLFSPEHPDGLRLKKRSQEDIIEFLNQHTNTNRLSSGKFPFDFGLISALDGSAMKLAEVLTNDSSNIELIQSIVSRFNDIQVSDSQAEMKKVYITMAKLSIERGWMFPYIEVDRLSRILDNGSISSSARILISKRINIARKFFYYV